MTSPSHDGADDLLAAVDRLAERLRGLSDVRLGRPLPGGAAASSPSASVADQACALAQTLADRSTGVDHRDAPTPPLAEPVPRLADLAVGHQVRVTGRDLVDSVRGLAPETQVWAEDERRSVGDVVRATAELVRALNREI